METKVRFMAAGDKIVLRTLFTAKCRGTMQKDAFLTVTCTFWSLSYDRSIDSSKTSSP